MTDDPNTRIVTISPEHLKLLALANDLEIALQGLIDARVGFPLKVYLRDGREVRIDYAPEYEASRGMYDE